MLPGFLPYVCLACPYARLAFPYETTKRCCAVSSAGSHGHFGQGVPTVYESMSFAKCRRESQHTAAQITSLEELLEGMAAGLAPVAKGIAVVFAHTVPCQ